MAEKMKWGILSTARINQGFIPALLCHPLSELHAVGSRSLERAEEYAAEWEIPRYYGSYDELLADPEIQVIYNPLPNYLHAEWTIRACQAGKHVLCEKPIALTPEEVDAIAAAARDNGVIVTEAFKFRHHHQTELVLQAIQQGRIGHIEGMRGAFLFALQDPINHRWLPETGGGSLFDVGCYPISYARMITGEPPEEVFGFQRLSSSGVDDLFIGELRYPGDILVQITAGFTVPKFTSFDIFGSRGRISMDGPYNPRPHNRLVITSGDEEEVHTFPMFDSFLGEIEDIALAITEGRQPRMSLEESRDNTATMVALLESARTGKPVRL